MPISEKTNAIDPSPTMKVAARAIELKSQGVDLIDLVVGEPDFPTPENIKQAAISALNNNQTKYTENLGLKNLRNAIVKKYEKDYKLSFSSDEVIVSNGAKQAVYNAINTVINPGDEVLIPSPYYVSYPHMVKLAGGKPIFIQTSESNNFKITPEDIQNNISEKTKLLILCNPCNPTGTLLNEEELKSIFDIANKNNLYVISDEVYEKLVFENKDFVSLAKFRSNNKNKVIIVNGMSKTYCMTGWRVGYAIASKNIINGMAKLQSHSTSGGNSISQVAAIEALNGDQSSLSKMVIEFQKRRDYLLENLNKIDGINCVKPDGAFYLFPDVSQLLKKSFDNEKIDTSEKLAMFLINEAKVAIVQGSAFGMEGYLRFSYATDISILETGISRIKSALKKLK